MTGSTYIPSSYGSSQLKAHGAQRLGKIRNLCEFSPFNCIPYCIFEYLLVKWCIIFNEHKTRRSPLDLNLKYLHKFSSIKIFYWQIKMHTQMYLSELNFVNKASYSALSEAGKTLW